ncbi:hypothetical protein Chor_002233 [Crotalus horridus]
MVETAAPTFPRSCSLPGPPGPSQQNAHLSQQLSFFGEGRVGPIRGQIMAQLPVKKRRPPRAEPGPQPANSEVPVVEWLKKNGRPPAKAIGDGPALLDLSWFTESMGAGRPVEIEPRHRLKVTTPMAPLEGKGQVPPYICQRRTPLHHHNSTLTDALETMAEEAKFTGSEVRSLAFSRAASVLKSLPWKVSRIQQLHPVPGIGEHSRRIIQLFTKIFGVGVRIASQWYQEGLRSLADLQLHQIKLNKEQQAGLLHYEDLNTPVELWEAQAISQVVHKVVEEVLPGAMVMLTGGFRRGKPCGHDVDLLITHPSEGQELGLLRKVIGVLESQVDEELWVSGGSSTMDHFERCLSIFHLGNLAGSHLGGAGLQKLGASAGPGASCPRTAVRVDLVVTPFSQFPFALLGWTGSRNFERDLRRFSKREKKMTLNSHGLYHLEQKIFLPAASEEEIFQHLGLEYLPPEERNA